MYESRKALTLTTSLVLKLWWLAPSFSLVVVRSDRHIYVRPNCRYAPCLQADPLRLHKGVLKGISCYQKHHQRPYIGHNIIIMFGMHYHWPSANEGRLFQLERHTDQLL